MKTLITFALLYPVMFAASYAVARYNQNDFGGLKRVNRKEALWIAAIAALFLSAAIIVPSGQSEL